jgi:hypothetical protein
MCNAGNPDNVDLPGIIDTEAGPDRGANARVIAFSSFRKSHSNYPFILVSFRNRLLTFATDIGGRYCGGCLAALSLG